MIPKECKRLAEVDFPIAAVSRYAALEKYAPKGHPSVVHQWWAPRPLGACRAMLLALLLPDPADQLCLPAFVRDASTTLVRAGLLRETPQDPIELRNRLLRFIGEIAAWDHSAGGLYLETARSLIASAYAQPALVADSFGGRGSIPLEALRLGCDGYSSDLNPVACLIQKVLLQDIPRWGARLAEELVARGTEIQKQAQMELADLYPADPDGAQPIAYIWARTVLCEAPNCGAEIPIFKSAWLANKGTSKAKFFRENSTGKCVALLIASAPCGGPVAFRIARGDASATEKAGYDKIIATKAAGNNANVICPCCGATLPGAKKNPRTALQLAAQRGGADVVFNAAGDRVSGARLLAVVTIREGHQGRSYRLPTDADYRAVLRAQQRHQRMVDEAEKSEQGPFPDESLPPVGTLGFRVQRYGILRWRDLFTARQAVMLSRLATLVSQATSTDSGNALQEVLACAMDRVAMSAMTCTRWNASAEKMQHTFGRQALPIVWDFAEVVPIANAPGSWQSGYSLLEDVITSWPKSLSGQVYLADAAELAFLPTDSVDIFFTDPPYYNAVPYAALSDFFLVWLKRTIPKHALLQDPYDLTNSLSPKSREAVQDERALSVDGTPKDKDNYEMIMAAAFAEGRRILRTDGIGCVVFAHKTTEGWEALLSGLIQGGWTITASWPIATEMGTRLRAHESAALATSIHLVVRPRMEDAGIGDWGQVLRELPKRVADWMQRLVGEGIRGADLVFACIGPALEIFSRYRSVETAEGRSVELREYLEKVWEVVGRTALEEVLSTAEAQARNGAAGALEEDARLTALFLWTLQSTAAPQDSGSGGSRKKSKATPSPQDPELEESDDGEDDDEESSGGGGKKKGKGAKLPYDVVRRFAQPLGIHLEDWERRIIETEKGVVRLLPVTERAQQLFGKEGAEAVAARLETVEQATPQLSLFPEDPPRGKRKGQTKSGGSPVSDAALRTRREATTLDRVHAAMLLQKSGRAQALRRLLETEKSVGGDFLRLANALSALYPTGTEEKRLVDAMLLAWPK